VGANEVWLIRHGETEWSRDHRHTSTTDLPLTEEGEEVARSLRPQLARDFALVLTSPRRRARDTAELAGHAAAEVDADLAEWAYGDYEGVTSDEIRESVPDWTVWTHPSPAASPLPRSPSGSTGWSPGCATSRATRWCSATGTRFEP
jgi:broad specificity phosphatase PhoE